MSSYVRWLAGVLLAAVVMVEAVGCEEKKPAPPPPPRPVRKLAPKPAPAPAAATATAPASAPAAAVEKPWTKGVVTTQQAFETFTKLNPKSLAVRVPRVEAEPQVDGVLDEAYQAATPLAFKFLSGRPGRPAAATTAYVVTTDKGLFVFFDCKQPDMEKIVAKVDKHDGAVWQDDSVEIFLDPLASRRDDYAQIVVNSLGITMDSRGKDLSYEPKLKVAAKRGEGGWTTEVGVPFDQLPCEPGEVRRVWTANFNRMAHVGEGQEDTAWCPTGGDSSHVPTAFGHLWLEGGTTHDVEYAAWVGPRHVYRPAPTGPMFVFKSVPVETLDECKDVTVNADGAYRFGRRVLANNSETLVVVTDGYAVQVSSVHSWRPIAAQWVNNHVLHIRRAHTEQEAYYCLYDVERRRVILEELEEDGGATWDKLTGTSRPAPKTGW